MLSGMKSGHNLFDNLNYPKIPLKHGLFADKKNVSFTRFSLSGTNGDKESNLWIDKNGK
jgi:hypothetical protein